MADLTRNALVASVLACAVLRAGAGVSSSLCAWLGDARGCHLGAGGAAVLASSAPANAAFASELVQYTACYQLTAADACSATLGMCSWVASTGGCTSVSAQKDFSAAAAECAAAATSSSLCATLAALVDPASICYRESADGCLAAANSTCELSPFTGQCQPGAGLALAQLAGGPALAAQAQGCSAYTSAAACTALAVPYAGAATLVNGTTVYANASLTAASEPAFVQALVAALAASAGVGMGLVEVTAVGSVGASGDGARWGVAFPTAAAVLAQGFVSQLQTPLSLPTYGAGSTVNITVSNVTLSAAGAPGPAASPGASASLGAPAGLPLPAAAGGPAVTAQDGPLGVAAEDQAPPASSGAGAAALGTLAPLAGAALLLLLAL